MLDDLAAQLGVSPDALPALAALFAACILSAFLGFLIGLAAKNIHLR